MSPRHGGTLQALAAVDGCELSPLTLPKGYGYPEAAVLGYVIQEAAFANAIAMAV